MASDVKFTWRGGRVNQILLTAAKRGVDQSMRALLTECRRLILETPKTGRRYGAHQASAPGEAPASRKGGLITLFRVSVVSKGDVVTGSLTNLSPNAKLLELGTIKMRPRPFLRPALANMKSRIMKSIANELAKALLRP